MPAESRPPRGATARPRRGGSPRSWPHWPRSCSWPTSRHAAARRPRSLPRARDPATTPSDEEESPPARGSGLDPRFHTCAQANAAGYGPYTKDADPEYAWYQDRDHDGIDCEPLNGAEPTTPEPSSGGAGLDPRFDTCAQANAAGYGPYYKDADPEYDWYQDRDHDGIDCEPWHGGGSSTPAPSETPSASTPTEEPSDSGPSMEPSPPEPSEEPSDQVPSDEPSAPAPSEEPSQP